MNAAHRPIPPDDLVGIDRLVDGELTDDEQRALLARLEESSDGWRRCALAFIEARCWARDLVGLVGEPSETQSAPRGLAQPELAPRELAQPELAPRGSAPREAALRGPAASAPLESPAARVSQVTAIGRPAPAWYRPSAGTLLAMAASFLVALGIGGWMRGVWPTGNDPRTSLARLEGSGQDATSDVVPSEPFAVDRQNSELADLAAAALRSSSNPIYDEPTDVWLAASDRHWDDPDEWSEADGLGDGERPSSHDDMLAALRELGHRVERHRELWNLSVGDGRVWLMPVERIDVQYVGDSYQ